MFVPECAKLWYVSRYCYRNIYRSAGKMVTKRETWCITLETRSLLRNCTLIDAITTHYCTFCPMAMYLKDVAIMNKCSSENILGLTIGGKVHFKLSNQKYNSISIIRQFEAILSRIYFFLSQALIHLIFNCEVADKSLLYL